MIDRFDDKVNQERDAKANTKLPETDADNRSDANDGVERPLGYYSSQAQADRSLGTEGSTPTNEAAGGPGFYSPEQQAARNAPTDLGVVRDDLFAHKNETRARQADRTEQEEKAVNGKPAGDHRDA